MWHQGPTVSRAQSEGNGTHKLDSLCPVAGDEQSSFDLWQRESSCVVLEPAFWGRKLEEAGSVSPFSCFLCPVIWGKLAGVFSLLLLSKTQLLHYTGAFGGALVQLIACFPLCLNGTPCSLRVQGVSPVAWERGCCLQNFQRLCQSLHKQLKIPRDLSAVFRQIISDSGSPSVSEITKWWWL